MAQQRKNTAKIFSAVATVLFSLGGIYYGFLLGYSFEKMRYTIQSSPDGSYVMVSDGIAPRAIPYLIALALLVLFLAVQMFALRRPGLTVMAAISAAAPLLFPLFTDVTLAEFTRVGLLPPVSAVKFIPFVLGGLLWALVGILKPE